jgi:hypothetical protein
MAEKALQQIRSEVLEQLADKMPADKATPLADKLSQGTWTHDHPISLKEAQELGLPAGGEMPDEVYQLMALYPQPTQRQQTVQYVPTPYGPPTSPNRKEK